MVVISITVSNYSFLIMCVTFLFRFDEMMAKRVEIRNEYAKEKPDQNRIGTLQKEMIDLRTKIQTVAEKQGLPAAGFGPGMMGRGMGNGPGMMGGHGRGGQGFGGQGRGYGNGPCGRM